MKAPLLKECDQLDQQKKIIQQIHDINKRLSNHNRPSKNPDCYLSLLKPQQDPEQKYFSQQCDDLFAGDQLNKNPNHNNLFDQSLFNSKNSLLLENNFEKQIKNFRQYSSNKFSSQNPIDLFDSSNSQHVNKPIIAASYNSKSIEGKKSSVVIKKNQPNPSSQLLIYKNQSQASLNKATSNTSSKRALNQKAPLYQKNMKNLIQNKQNIQTISNVPKQSFIKQIKKKIRFQTLPDQQTFSQDFISFQIGKQHKLCKNLFYPIQDVKPKNQPNNQNRTFECTFKPSILKKSHDIAQNLQPSFERLTQDISISKSQSKIPYKAKQQLTDKKYSVKRLEQLSQPRKIKENHEKEEPNYDFRPTLSKKSLSQMANCTMDVASRNKLWLQQKQAKLSKLKEEEEDKKNKIEIGCFAPKINKYKGENQVHMSRFMKQGISSYFERVSMAKQKTQVIEKKTVPVKEQVKVVDSCMKKKTYEQAVRELHKKILAMNI